MSEGQLRWRPDNPTRSRRYCSVPGCGSRVGPMFTFPKDPPMRQLWAIQCKIQREVSRTMVICRRHFADTDVMLSCAGTMKPKHNTYPSLHLPQQVIKRGRRNCNVHHCTRSSDDADVLLHLFPRNPVSAERWMAACKMQSYSRATRVCSAHFLATDYVLNNGDRTLRAGVVPSVDLPASAAPPAAQKAVKSRQWTIMSRQGIEISAEVIDESSEGSEEAAADAEAGRADAAQQDAQDDDEDNLDEDLDDEYMSDDEAGAKEDPMDVCRAAVPEARDEPPPPVLEAERDMVQGLMVSFIRQNLTAAVKAVKLSDMVPMDPLSSFDIADNGDKPLSILDLIKTESQTLALAGVSSSVLDCLAQLLTLIVPPCQDAELSMKQRVVLTLTKLRTNMGFEVLSTFFGVDRQACGKYFASTVRLMALVLGPCIYWPTKEENVKTLPRYFHRQGDTVLMVDMVEIALDSTTNCLKCHSALHAANHGKSSIKFLVGLAPSGLVVYLGKAYSGLSPDKKILEESDLIVKQLVKPNRGAVMIDRELNLDSVWKKHDIKVYHTPNIRWGNDLLNAKKQVDKCVQKMKIFSILSGKLCNTTAPHIDDILTVIAGLVNLTSSLISSERILAVKECAC